MDDSDTAPDCDDIAITEESLRRLICDDIAVLSRDIREYQEHLLYKSRKALRQLLPFDPNVLKDLRRLCDLAEKTLDQLGGPYDPYLP